MGYGFLMKYAVYEMLKSLDAGSIRLSELKESLGVPDAVFNAALEALRALGLVRIVTRDGVEYLELTDEGKAIRELLVAIGWPLWGWGRGWGWRGWCKRLFWPFMRGGLPLRLGRLVKLTLLLGL